MHKIFILFLSVFLCTVSYAQTASRQIPKFILNAGTYTEFYNNIQIDDVGGVRKFEPAPTLGFGLWMPLKYDFYFVPEINWVLPRKSGERILKNIFMLRGDFSYKALDWFHIRLGTSIFWLNQQGLGGTERINNGNTVSTFYYPEENRSSLNNTLDLGLEALYKNWALRFQTYTFSALKAQRRQVSYSIFLSYYWDR